jgi:hypothetical protein
MATKLWTGNALAVNQIQTYAPGAQLPGTTISATINGKTASYTSATGTNDDLIAGLVTAINGILRQAPEFAEVAFLKIAYSPAVPAPNSTYLQMSSQTPGVPFTVAINLTQPAMVTVTRVASGAAAVNEVQQIAISPNAESGSSFTLTWGGHTTSAIPIPPSAPSAAAGSSGTLNGSYKWGVTFLTSTGETELGLITAALTLTSQQGSLTSVPTGPSGTTARNIYRTKAGGSTFYQVGQIADNTTATYTDSSSDATIGVNPSPPPTNGVLQAELEALSGVGQGNVKVSGTSTPAYAGMTMPTSTVVYTIEFRGSLGGASQALVSGNVANVTILPPVSISTVTVGCPPQSEIQTVGWKQVIGTSNPTGTFTITLPGLGVTTAPLLFNASAATVQAALVAAAGPAYANAFTVTLTQSTAAGYIYQVAYANPLDLQAVPLATVDVSKLAAATGDTVTGYQTRTQSGTKTGRNSAITVTLQNGPSGGTFGLTGTLANGNTITASSVAYNASAATLKGDFPTNTVSVSGSAGGPYTIEAVGEAASQAISWSATSSLTGGSSLAASPPSSNTSGISPPTGVTAGNPGSLGGGLTAGSTYYWVVTATNSAGETTASAEVSYTIPSTKGAAFLSWNQVAGANGYKVYRGTSSGGENILAATLSGQTATSLIDSGPTNTSASQSPGSDGTFSQTGAATTNGTLSAGTYYYVLKASTHISPEITVTLSGSNNAVQLHWTGSGLDVAIYRGTSSGGENVLIATVPAADLTYYLDAGGTATSATPPSSNTAVLSAPTQNNLTTSTSAGSLAAATYYYEVTATDAAGETTASNEKSATLGATGEITVSWNALTGASGYKIYRGTSTGAENTLVAVIVGGSTTSYVDVGSIPALFNSTEITQGKAAVNEQQTVTLSGATGGTFSLAFEGQGTPALNYNDTAADVQTKLQALASVGSGNLTVSGSAGGPFTVTAAGSLAATALPLIAANSTNLSGTASVSQTLTTTQAATGPNFWDNANNWSPTGVPANGDSVYFQNSTVDCLYNLAQSSTTLANLQIDMSFVGGQIGLPSWNGKYYEYRQQYLQIGVSGTILIGSGKGSGPTLIKLDTGTNATNFLINGCGTSLDPTLPAILWKGNRSSGTTTLNISKGSIGIAVYAGETATVDQINQGYVTNVKSDSSIFVGPGTTINTEWFMTGGQGTLNAACPTLLMENGTLTILDGLSATAVTTLTVVGGSVSDRSTGTITTLTVGTGATYDRSDDSRGKTVSNCTISGKSTFLDPNDTITFTNPLSLSDCSLLDVTLDLGTNITLSRNSSSAVATALQDISLAQGRLTLTSGTPITTSDVTGASTIYFTPFRGNQIALWNGTIWQAQNFSELSLALSGLTSGLPYDVFIYNNSGTLTLEAVAWTSSSARATALTTQNGIYVKSGSTSHRYLGTFITTGATTTEDSYANRYVWNYYNRAKKWGSYADATSHTYSTNAWRQWNANANAKLNFVVGVIEETINASVVMWGSASSATGYFGIGVNSTSTASATFGEVVAATSTSVTSGTGGSLEAYPALGKNYICPLENAVSGSPTYAYTELHLGVRC